MFTSLFRKPTETPPLRETAVGVVVTEIAINLGLDSDSAAHVARFAKTILASGMVATCDLAIERGRQLAIRFAEFNNNAERHGNLGWVPIHHFDLINRRDPSQPPTDEDAA